MVQAEVVGGALFVASSIMVTWSFIEGQRQLKLVRKGQERLNGFIDSLNKICREDDIDGCNTDIPKQN